MESISNACAILNLINQKEKFYAEMIQDPLFSDYRPEQCQQDLTMLTGNPHAFDNGTAAGNFLYQMIQMDLEIRKIKIEFSEIFPAYKRQKS